MKSLTPLVFAAIVSSTIACDREAQAPPKSPAAEPAQTEAAAMKEAVEEVAPSEPAPLHPSIANLSDEQWCEVAHADTVKLVEGIRASMKRTGQDDPTYAAPPREEYVTACRKLPLAMQKCLVLAYSMQHKDVCQKTQDELGPDDQQVYKELMGK